MARGGKREGAGRPSGSRDAAARKEIANISELARENTELALSVLVEVATGSDSDAARVSAANAILDRGYGKAPQSLDLSNKDGTLARPHTILLRGPDDDSDPADTA